MSGVVSAIVRYSQRRPVESPTPVSERKGPPERPWFKNQIYAPGAYTGYGAKPIAAVREYMDEKKWKEAEAQVPGVAKIIETAAAGINQAADDLEKAVAQTH
ncbi:MAG TPA: transferrin receptor-like dimerization domain-containing protein [Candidatus Angelobacter sp.]